MISRRQFLTQAAGLAAVSLVLEPRLAAACPRLQPLAGRGPSPQITIYKSPTCGCCAQWVEHLKLNGYATETHDLDPVDPIKDRYGVPRALRSCHTALVSEYVLEGHVPADDIQRLLRERPHVAGLAVPGMPQSAPGMYQPGDARVPYEVLAFQKSGATSLYAKH